MDNTLVGSIKLQQDIDIVMWAQKVFTPENYEAMKELVFSNEEPIEDNLLNFLGFEPKEDEDD